MGLVEGVTGCDPQVPDGATVALVPCLTKHVLRENQDYVPGEREYCPPPSSPHQVTVLCPLFAQSPVTGKVLWTLGWACVYFPSTERSPQPMPLLLEVGRTLGAQGRWYLMRGEELWGLGTGTPMLEDVDEGGIRPWHLVKPSEEPEPPRPRRGSLRGGERERAKAIPEIYLTRLLSMKVGQDGRGGRLGSGPGQASGLGCGGGRLLRGFGVVWGLHEHGATGRPRPGWG